MENHTQQIPPFNNQGAGILQDEDSIDFNKWIGKVLMNWYFFGIACFIALAGAYIFNKRILPVQQIKASVIVENGQGSPSSMTSMFLGTDMFAGASNYANSIVILPSFKIIGRAVDRLDLEVDYVKKTLFQEIPYYKNAPIKITFAKIDPRMSGRQFKLEDIDGKHFILEHEEWVEIGLPEIKKEYAYGEIITTPWYTIQVELTEVYYDLEKLVKEGDIEDEDYSILFTYRSRTSLMKEFNRRLEVSDLMEEGGSVMGVSINSANPQRDLDFLNMLLEEFINHNLDRKNEQSVKTINFIQDMLGNIADSLSVAENALVEYRTDNRIMNISTQASSLIERVYDLEQQKAELRVQHNYYTYLKDYLDKGSEDELISPTTLGIEDPNVIKMVTELSEIQRISNDMPKGSPGYLMQMKKFESIRKMLLETTNNILASSDIALESINDRIDKIEDEAKNLPSTEKKLLGIERTFKVNDAYYTFLLERLSEAQVTKASNTSDNFILDEPMVIETVNKNKAKINYAIALLLGLLVPFIILVINDSMDLRVHTKMDIEKVSKKPIVGMITRTKKEGRVLTYKYPKSGFAEAFRSLRTRIEFMARDHEKISLMITSSLPGDGKSFISINTAGVFGLTGKKTVLLGFDLRKPKATTYLGVRVEKGLSNYLAGKAELKDIIIRPESANFDFIPSGTIPPNPGELMSSIKMKELFDSLKEEYDVIVVDTPPTGVVSDGLWISPYVDLNFFVVRHNYTDKNLLKEVLENAEVNNLKNIGLIVNDVVKAKERIPYISRYILGGKYGYAYNYGYGYNYGYIDGGYVED